MAPIRRGEPRVDEEREASVSDTEENKALVRRFFEAQNRGDLAAVEGMMTLDFVNHHRGFAQQLSREGYIRDLIDIEPPAPTSALSSRTRRPTVTA